MKVSLKILKSGLIMKTIKIYLIQHFEADFHPWAIYLVQPVWRDPLTVFSWTVHSISPSVQVSLALVCLYQLVGHPSFGQIL